MKPNFLLPLALILLTLASCQDAKPTASARIVTHPSELIGGPRAHGAIGDFLLENDKVRAIIQAPGQHRSVGYWAGYLIDLDIQRPRAGDGTLPTGNDLMTEVFPIALLQQPSVISAQVLADGSDGGPAIVRTRGGAGDFQVGMVNRLAIGSNTSVGDEFSEEQIEYVTDWILEPGAQYIRVETAIVNISENTLKIPTQTAVTGLSLVGLDVEGMMIPTGISTRFSSSTSSWLPYFGFDSRQATGSVAAAGVGLPTIPGAISPWVAAIGDGTSYALVPEYSEERNYA